MQFHILVVPYETGISAKFLGYYLSSHWKVELPHITSPDIGFRQLRLNQSTIISSLSFSFLLQFFSHTFIFYDNFHLILITAPLSLFSNTVLLVEVKRRWHDQVNSVNLSLYSWSLLLAENIWKRKMYFLEEKKKFWFLLWMRRNEKKIFGKGKYISCGGKEKRRRKRKRRKS